MNNTNIDKIAAAQNALRIDPIPEGYDLEDLAIAVEYLCICAGGELPRRQKVLDLFELYGVERVWTQAQYLWDRIASSRTKVLKPTAWFVRSVEENWSPPGAPLPRFMNDIARLYVCDQIDLRNIPERHHDEIRRLAKPHFDALYELPF